MICCKACSSVVGAVDPIDRDKIQNSLNDFTACLRDEGLQVDDITFGPPGGAGGTANGAAAPGGSARRATVAAASAAPPGGVASSPAGGQGGPGGAGFDPTGAAHRATRPRQDRSRRQWPRCAKCEPIMTERVPASRRHRHDDDNAVRRASATALGLVALVGGAGGGYAARLATRRRHRPWPVRP